MQIRILYISSTPISNTTGGGVLMYNHLALDPEFTILEINDTTYKAYHKTSLTEKIFTLFKNTRFSKLYNHYYQLYKFKQPSTRLINTIESFEPDLILTVAHGTLFSLATSVAQKMDLPLVSVYHDWWPKLLAQTNSCYSYTINKISKKFLKLAKNSNLVFSISLGMHKMLGELNQSVILYPNSAKQNTVATSNKTSSKFTVSYAGNLSLSYGRLIRQLLDNQPDELDFNIYGNPYDWPEDMRIKHKKNLKGEIFGESYNTAMQSSDALLTVLSFEPDLEILFRTNFPSKVINYCAYNKPLIIWGPAYSTGISFMEHHIGGLTIANPNPKMAWRKIYDLSQDIEKQKKLAQKARILNDTIFERNNLQDIFKSNIIKYCLNNSLINKKDTQ